MHLIFVLVVTNYLFCSSFKVATCEDQSFGKGILGDKKPKPSPIDLIRNSMITKKTWKPLRFSSEHSALPESITSKRTKDGLEVTFDFADNTPTIADGTLKFTYEFDKLFFHWDNDLERGQGSYHATNGKYFPMELQAYYKIISKSTTFAGILQGIVESTVIVSQLFKLSDEDNPTMEKVLNKSSTFNLDQLIPPLKEYAMYKGSLVVSPFTENVLWFISLKPQRISKLQLMQFSAINETAITDARPIQPLYGRKVFYVMPWNN